MVNGIPLSTIIYPALIGLLAVVLGSLTLFRKPLRWPHFFHGAGLAGLGIWLLVHRPGYSPFLYSGLAGALTFLTVLFWKRDYFGLGPIARVGPFVSDRWANLEFQLGIIKKCADRLTPRTVPDRGLSEIVLPHLRAIKEIYWDYMRNPLSKALVVGLNDDVVVLHGIPKKENWQGDLRDFFGHLETVPSLASSRPFCGNDIERLLAYSLDIPKPENLVYINKFLMENNLEFCFPCISDEKIAGALFLGSKKRGIFWPQELRALQMISSHLAGALELLTAEPAAEAVEKI